LTHVNLKIYTKCPPWARPEVPQKPTKKLNGKKKRKDKSRTNDVNVINKKRKIQKGKKPHKTSSCTKASQHKKGINEYIALAHAF
jgi:hypothetical protein